MAKNTIFSLIITLFLAPSLGAHPVSFKGGYSFMAFHQADMTDWQLLYTFHPRSAIGVDYIKDSMEPESRYFLIPRLSWLVKRWNSLESQGNLYVYGGVGVARQGALTQAAALGAVEADYETQEVYVSGKATQLRAEHLNALEIYQLRAGFAPYVGESGDLHAWLIGQAQYLPNATMESLRVGPVLRLFHRNVLWELGLTTQGSWNFNFMVHW